MSKRTEKDYKELYHDVVKDYETTRNYYFDSLESILKMFSNALSNVRSGNEQMSIPTYTMLLDCETTLENRLERVGRNWQA